MKEEEGVRVLSDLLLRNLGNFLGICDLFIYYFYKGNCKEVDEFYLEFWDVLLVLVYYKEKFGLIYVMMGEYEEVDDLFE